MFLAIDEVKVVSNLSIFFQIQSALVVGLMLAGVYFRKRVVKHMRFMKLAIFIDFVLILQIELNRHVIFTAAKVLENRWILNIHVFLAVSTVLTYFFILYSGPKLWKSIKNPSKSRQTLKKWHLGFGWSCLFLRVATFFTSFFVMHNG